MASKGPITVPLITIYREVVLSRRLVVCGSSFFSLCSY